MDTGPSTSSHPLRPYAVIPEAGDWSLGSIPSASSSRLPPSSSSASPSIRVSPPTNRYTSTISDLDHADAPAAGAMLKAFVTSSLLSFTGTALVMPFEVGKTLAQVQWVPKEGLDNIVQATLDEIEEESVEIEDENEAEAYFADLSNVSQPGFAPPTDAPPRPTSPSGYLLRSGINDARYGTKPEWVMPVVVQGGVWDMIKTVGRWKGEGWASLWKGQLTTFILDSIVTTLQPIVLTTLTVIFLPSSPLSSLPIIYSPSPAPLLLLSTISHALATIAVSPLDLVRTRLVVQSAQPLHRKYKGPYDALRTIFREEGGVWSTYFHPNLFIPTLLEGILRPVIHLSTPLIISRYLLIEPSTSPLSFGLAELLLGTAGLLITIPIETIRKRLQIQSRADFVRAGRAGGTGRAWRTCVETRPAPYVGVVEAAWRIMTEETGRIPRRRRRSSKGAASANKDEPKEDLGLMGLGVGSGLTQLYRGLGMGVGANCVVFLLGLVAGGGEGTGWAEM
ncbi:mitochondrial carrier domain-containing protein [Leucosporidium creatinivorum]|uniref:Mitochondrial carrier domain-containing protein n=1 Tax=Leucosporidium creatinivorum TaxID=106004 RepID=A0A1Y2G1C9_9BASI|nr:mitochondrial carrier domain-containing protein [Leucosporidium creatinivorum]